MSQLRADPNQVFCSCGRLIRTFPAFSENGIVMMDCTFDLGPVCEQCQSSERSSDSGIQKCLDHSRPFWINIVHDSEKAEDVQAGIIDLDCATDEMALVELNRASAKIKDAFAELARLVVLAIYPYSSFLKRLLFKNRH